MRRLTLLITTLAFSLSGLVSSPAQSAVPVPADGNYSCSTGLASPGPSSQGSPKYSIYSGKVSFGRNCTGTVVIPDGVTSFGNGAFRSSSLTNINIPSSLTVIEDNAFGFANSLTSITADSANPNFSSSAGILFNKLGTTLVIYPAAKPGTSYSIPSNVTNIGDYAFFNATALTSVTIPEGVTRIGKAAFDFAGSITSINLPSSVTTIEEYAFSRTTSLTSINIPAGVTSIGDYAFFSTTSLTSITIPASVTSLGNEVFNSATALTTVTFEPGSPLTRLGNSVFFGATSLSSITIPSGVTSIAISTFAYTTSLTSITIPSGVTSIGNTAFYGSGSLNSVYFVGSAAPTVGNSAFTDVAGSAKAYIKSGATGFGAAGGTWNGLIVTDASADGTYLCTTGLASSSTPNFTIASGVVSQGTNCNAAVVVPFGVTSIGSSAFTNSGITSIALPSSLISIGGSAFWEATSLTSITIPASVTSIGSGAFYKTSLTSVTLPSGLTSIEDSVFDLVTSLTSITIPETVTSIGKWAFYGASSLTSITIPSSVTNFGDEVFWGTSALTSVYFLGNAPATVGATPFIYTAPGAKAYIKTGASGFGNLGSTWNGLVVAITTVTYNTNGGSLVSAQAYDGRIATPTAPTRTGYAFDGWSATNGGSVLTFPYTPPANIDVTLFAKWTAVVAPVVTPSPNNPYNEPNLGGSSPNVVTPSPNVVTPAPNVVTLTSSVTTAKAISIQLPRFYISSSVLTDSQKTELKSLVSKSGKKATFVVTGSAGKLQGVSDSAVKALAAKRGEIARAYLVKLGVSKSKITIQVKISNQGIVPKTKILAKYLVSQ